MERPTKPKWYTTDQRLLATVSDDMLENWRTDWEEYRTQINAYNAYRKQKYNEMLELAKELYPSTYPGQNKVLQYLRKNSINQAYVSDFESEIVRPVENSREEILKKQKAAEAALKEEALVNEAVLWLQAKGEKLGDDFSVSTAVGAANDLAFNEEVSKRRAEGGYISFYGDEYCEDCKGWDMTSHRCDCGNRRVGWEAGYGHSFKEPIIHAEAN